MTPNPSPARVKPNRAPSAGPTPWTSRLVALPPEVLTCCVAALLARCVKTNDTLPSKGPITRFHAKDPSQLSLEQYLARLTIYTPYPRDCVLLTVIYLDRISRLAPTADAANLKLEPTPLLLRSSSDEGQADHNRPVPTSCADSNAEQSPKPIINSYTVHRLLMATLLVSCKFSVDGLLLQQRAAKVGGVGLRELVRLEVEVLTTLGWQLGYTLDEIEGASKELWRLGRQDGLINVEDQDDVVATSAIPRNEPTSMSVGGPTGPEREREHETDDAETPRILATQSFDLAGIVPSAPTTALSNIRGSDEDSLTSSSGASSAAASPMLFSPPHRGDVLSPTPPSSEEGGVEPKAGDEGFDPVCESRTLGSRPSTETVRRLEHLALGP